MASESYDDLIFKLGDLAREHLAQAKRPPRHMEAVFAAEDVVLARRDELKALENELNQEDADFEAFLSDQEAEKAQQNAVIAKWRSAVLGVEGRSRALKKKLSSQKAALRYQKASLKRAEASFKEMELREGHDLKKLTLTKENLKKTRLHLMREQRNIEELEWELNQVLTPRPGQQGAAGILAHKRILDMEDERDIRTEEHEARMKEVEALIVSKEEDEKEAEAELDGTLFDLGEEVYADRTPHPQLNPMYPRIDKAR